MTDRSGLGFGQGELDTAEGVPHTVAFDRAPDTAELMATRGAERLHRIDTCISQAAAHALPDAGDVVEVKDVERFGQFIEVDRNQSVRLVTFARKLGDKAVGSEANGSLHRGADPGGQGFFNFQGFCFGYFRILPVGGHLAVHFIDRKHGLDVNMLVNERFDPLVEADVFSMIGLNKLDAGAEVAGLANEGAGLDAKGFRLVTGGDTGGRVDAGHGDHADGTAPEARLELLLDGSKETVEIDKKVAQGHLQKCAEVQKEGAKGKQKGIIMFTISSIKIRFF